MKKIIKSNFSLENASGGKVFNAKNIFWIATLYQKLGRKIIFIKGRQRGSLGKLVLLRYSLNLIPNKFFIIIFNFPPKANAHDKQKQLFK